MLGDPYQGADRIEQVEEEEYEYDRDQVTPQGTEHVELEYRWSNRRRRADNSTSKTDQSQCDACCGSGQDSDQNRSLYSAGHQDHHCNEPDQGYQHRLAGQIAERDHSIWAEPYE